MWKKLYSQEYFLWLLLVLILFIPTLPLFHSGLPITHDGKDHVARIANFYLSLSEGNIIPRWAENLNWGYGHPILMFLYPLPSYLASFFHFLGLGYVDSTKVVFGTTYILSGLSMYLWLKSFVRRDAALLGALLYTFAPYRFVDLYVRGAIGEHVAFVFIPLVCYFLLKLSQKVTKGGMIGGALSLALLILSHNAVSLMALPFILLYMVYVWFQTAEKRAFLLSAGFILINGFLLSGFFWIPSILEGKYTLRHIVLKDQYLDRFSSFLSFFYAPWSYGQSGQLSVQLGVIHWVVLLSGVILFFKKSISISQKIFIGVLMLSVLMAVFLMMEISLPLWKLIPLIQQFQFPWRFLFVPVFALAVLGAVVANRLKPLWVLGIIGISIFSWLVLQYPYWQVKGYYSYPESYYAGVYAGTTDTGESAPIWSVRFMEDYPKAPIELIGGKGSTTQHTRNSTKHVYQVVANTPMQLRENTLYFPGWKVLVDNVPQTIEYQDPHNRGVMTFTVPQGKHVVQVLFTNTKLRLISDYLSLASLVILGILSILSKRIWQRFL